MHNIGRMIRGRDFSREKRLSLESRLYTCTVNIYSTRHAHCCCTMVRLIKQRESDTILLQQQRSMQPLRRPNSEVWTSDSGFGHRRQSTRMKERVKKKEAIITPGISSSRDRGRNRKQSNLVLISINGKIVVF